MPTATERIQEVMQTTAEGKPKIALDTCCVQYYISNPPLQPWADCLDPIFQAAINGKVELYVSTVVVSELLAHVYFANRHNTGYDAELDLLAIMSRHFQILDVDNAVAKAAGRLRGSYAPGDKIALKTPDALIGATSLMNAHTLFITNDAQLADALPETNCIYLRDVALEWLAQNYPTPCFNGGVSVAPAKNGKGLPTGFSMISLELGSVQPDPSAKWKRILKDAQIVASMVNEPCVFFILGQKSNRRVETREVLFWHENLIRSRPPKKVIRRLHDHLGYSSRTGTAVNTGGRIHGLVFASLAREKARQDQPDFASKSNYQKEADAWNGYLNLLRTYRPCLDLPQTSWLLCENGTTKGLDVLATKRFLDRAKNVLGWKEEL